MFKKLSKVVLTDDSYKIAIIVPYRNNKYQDRKSQKRSLLR